MEIRLKEKNFTYNGENLNNADKIKKSEDI